MLALVAALPLLVVPAVSAPPSAAAAGCIASGTDADINAALTGPGAVAELCPGAVFNLHNRVTLSAPFQRLTTQGQPHSDRMRLVERYRRSAYDTLDVSLTIDDPQTYTKPWVTNGRIRLASGSELAEYFCVPSEEEAYRKLVREPAGGAAR